MKTQRHPAALPRFGAIPESVILAGVVAAIALLYSCCAGCGGGAYRAQYATIDVAAELTAGASEVVYAATRADIDAGCAATLAPPDFAACAAAVGATWQPAQAAIGSMRLGLGGWYEGTRIAEVHGASLGDVALQGAAALVRAYVELADLLAPLGHVLPPLPDIVVAYARGLGGER
jgi:hypothetical protein